MPHIQDKVDSSKDKNLIESKRYYQSISSKTIKPDPLSLIVQKIEEAQYPISPREIASLTKLNPNSVRSYLSKLTYKGVIERVRRGKYRINEGYGYPLIRPRVQNIRGYCVVGVVVDEELIFRVGGVGFLLWFNVGRGRVSFVVSCDVGLDHYGVDFVRDKLESVCAERGLVDLDWVLDSFEVLRDHDGVRLEGVSCVTFSGLSGFLEKFYNRDGMRHERRVSGAGIGFTELTDFLDGGLDRLRVVDAVSELSRRIGALEVSSKRGNKVLIESRNGVQALMDAWIRERDGS